MVLCNVECVEKVAEYLDVSPGNLTVSDDNVISQEALEGFSTVIQSLVKNSSHPDILGDDAEVQALSRQWLEYTSLCINFADNPVNRKRVLKELNAVLRDCTYITGMKKTIADVTLYYILHSIMKGLGQEEKARYVNLSRWFDNVQQEAKLRQKLDLVNFNLMHLYL